MIRLTSARAGLTAAVRLPIGEIRTVDVAWSAFNRLVAEVCAVAEADGSPVPQAAQEGALALAQGHRARQLLLPA